MPLADSPPPPDDPTGSSAWEAASPGAPVSAADAEGSTRERILDAAERVFASHDFAEATLRPITTAAGVNLAAVNYHFGDKESLYLAVIRRRLQPLNTRRLALLAAAEAAPRQPAGAPVPVRELVLALVAPMRPFLRGGEEPHPFLRCMGRMMLTPPPFVRDLLREEFTPVLARFGAAFLRVLPHLTPVEFMLRAQCLMGAIHFTMTRGPGWKAAFFPGTAAADPDAHLEQLVAFCTAGLSAPRPPGPPVL